MFRRQYPTPKLTTSMKKPLIPRTIVRRARDGFCLALGMLALSAPTSFAAIKTWVGTTSDWGTASNWNTAVVPVAADTALFNIGTNLAVSLGGVDRPVRIINFDTNAGSFTISPTGSESLLVGSAGNASILATATGTGLTETINAPFILGSGAAAVTYTFTNNSADASNTMVFGGQISGGTTATSTLTLSGANTGNNTINGNIVNGTGTAAVTKSGAGTWTLSGANTYTGLTSITAGTLKEGASNALGSGALTINGATAIFDLGANHTDTVGTVTLQGGGSITGTGTSALSSTAAFALQNGSVSAILGGSNGINKTTTGTVTLSGANSYTGTTSVTGGTLSLSGVGTLGATSAPLSVSGASTILDLGGTTQTVGSVTLVGAAIATPSTIQNGSLTTNGGYTVTGGNNTTAIISANLSGSSALSFTGGALVSTLVLSGSNSYSGGTNLNAGLLAVGSDDALGSGTLTLNTTNVTSGLQSTGGAHTISNAVTAAGSQVNVLISSGSNDLTFSGLITNTQAAGRTYTVNNSGLTTFSGGLVLSGVALADVIHIFTGSGDLTISSTISDGLNSGGKIQYKGTGIFTLSGSNTFGGAVEVTGAGGTISLRNDLALGTAGGGNNSVAAGSTFEFQNNISIVGESLLVSGAGVGGNGALRNVSGTNSFAGVVALSADSTIKSESGTLSLSGASSLTLAGTVLTLDGAGDINVAGTVTGTTGSITKNGTGTVTLSGSGTYTGTTAVNAGTLVISSAGSISDTSAVTVASGAKLAYNSSTARTGSITLSGVDASNRATLGGTGTIDAALTLDNIGDTLSPGNSPGIQPFATGQTWNSFTYLWETNNFTGTTAGTDFDQITITGGLNLTGGSGAYGLDLHSLTAGNVPGDVPNFSELATSWTILTTTAGITGFNAANWTITDTSFTSSPAWVGSFSISQSGNNLVLSYAVPEPSTWALLAFSLTTVMVMRRRRS